VRILHLSDFHFSEEREWEADPVLSGLLDDLAELYEQGLAPHLIAITGDVAYHGRDTEYDAAWEWLQKLLRVTGLLASDLLLVPGNHDVNRRSVKDDILVLPLQETILRKKCKQYVASVLRTDSSRQVMLRRHEAWFRFLDKLGISNDGTPWWSSIREIAGLRLGFAGLCSTWMSWRDEDPAHLLIGQWQVNTLLKALREKGNADILLALVHHPWAYLAPWDKSKVEPRVHQHFHLLLRGHDHKTEPRFVEAGPRAIFEITAGSCFDRSDWPNGYLLLELDRERWSCRLLARTWNGQEWVPDRNAFPPHGETERPLPGARPEARPRPIGRVSGASGSWDAAMHALIRQWEEEPAADEGWYIPLRGAPPGAYAEIERLHNELRETPRSFSEEVDRLKQRIQKLSSPLEETIHQWLRTDDAGPLYLLGDYGTGKSLFLRKLAARLAADWLRDPQGALLPLHAPLNRFIREELPAGDRDLWGCLARSLRLGGLFPAESGKALRRALEGRRVVLLLDGFDELPRSPDEADTPEARFAWLIADHGRDCRVLVSGRTHLNHAPWSRVDAPKTRSGISEAMFGRDVGCFLRARCSPRVRRRASTKGAQRNPAHVVMSPSK
jgi:predicted MPP superfamily phosphohydrolase